jgi:hypothetical protein
VIGAVLLSIDYLRVDIELGPELDVVECTAVRSSAARSSTESLKDAPWIRLAGIQTRARASRNKTNDSMRSRD